MDTKSRGIVYLVGAGPGDPGLLTVRGRELLADCDAVVFDALANPALLPAPDAEGRPERHDVGKRGGSAASARQDEINGLLVDGPGPSVPGRGSAGWPPSWTAASRSASGTSARTFAGGGCGG